MMFEVNSPMGRLVVVIDCTEIDLLSGQYRFAARVISVEKVVSGGVNKAVTTHPTAEYYGATRDEAVNQAKTKVVQWAATLRADDRG